MKLTLKIWRQKNTDDAGEFVTYQARCERGHVVPRDVGRGERGIDC